MADDKCAKPVAHGYVFGSPTEWSGVSIPIPFGMGAVDNTTGVVKLGDGATFYGSISSSFTYLPLSQGDLRYVKRTDTGSTPVDIKRYVFSEAEAPWIIPHGMNTRKFMERMTDSNGVRFAAGVTIIDDNTIQVDVGFPCTGTVDIIFDTAGSPDITL